MSISTYKNRTLIILFFILVVTGIVFITYQYQKLENNLNDRMSYLENIIRQNFHNQLENTKKEYSKKVDTMLSLDGVTEAFASQDRDKLYNLVKTTYDTYKHSDNHLKIMTFRLTDGSTFLRVHKPAMFGDKLNKKRTIILDTNKDKKRLFGFEVGKLKMSYRIVTPIFHKGKHIGLVEVGILPEKFTSNLTDLFKISHALVVKTADTNISLKKEKYIQKGNFSLVNGEDMFKEIFELSMNTNEALFKFSYKDNHYLVDNNLILLNHKGSIAAKVLLAHNVTTEQNRFNDFLIEAVIVAILIFLFLFIVLNAAFNHYIKEVTKSERELKLLNRTLEIKVKEKTQELQLLNDHLEDKVQEEIAKNKDKEKLLFQQSKMASMGEMIGNIAHQWRQPLNEISTSASTIKVNKEFGLPLEDKDLFDIVASIMKSTNHLSNTIDDFRNFFRQDKEKTIFSLKSTIDKDLQLIDASFKNKGIEILVDVDENIEVYGYQNELTQAFLNIFSNARDILGDLDDIERKLIIVKAHPKKDKTEITIQDNGGGISDEIISKVFEPYFTTKHQSQGTGIGLYMTHQIIVNHMEGEINVVNESYEVDGITYTGAKFIITLPNK